LYVPPPHTPRTAPHLVVVVAAVEQGVVRAVVVPHAEALPEVIREPIHVEPVTIVPVVIVPVVVVVAVRVSAAV
jgi:hypothetical protein